MAEPNKIQPCYIALGRRIGMLRQIHDMTQTQLSQASGVPRTSLVSIENGHQRIMLHDVGRLAKALGVKGSDLMRGILD